MNYYERHLGDWLKDTLTLSMIEEGAYNRLVDVYYAQESGIDHSDRYRAARAMSAPERAAVDKILGRYFRLIDGKWVKGRIEEELEGARKRITAAQQNGRSGGRPRKQTTTQEKPTGFSLGSDPVTKNETQEQTGSKAHHLSKHHLSNLVPIHQESDKSAEGARGDARAHVRPSVDVCKRLVAAGFPQVSPDHPQLLAALDAGATPAEFESTYRELTALGKPVNFGYLIATVAGRRRDAATAPKARGSPIDRPSVAASFDPANYTGTPDDKLPRWATTDRRDTGADAAPPAQPAAAEAG